MYLYTVLFIIQVIMFINFISKLTQFRNVLVTNDSSRKPDLLYRCLMFERSKKTKLQKISWNHRSDTDKDQNRIFDLFLKRYRKL